MRKGIVQTIILCVLAVLAPGCASKLAFTGPDGEPLVPRGDELCAFRKVSLNEPWVAGTVTSSTARQLVLNGVARSEVGLTIVDRTVPAEVVIDFIVNDATACVHCPEKHNYVSWSLIFSEARGGRAVASIGRYGWKLIGSQEKAIATGIRSLRSNCQQPNSALQPTPQAPGRGSIRETPSARLRSG